MLRKNLDRRRIYDITSPLDIRKIAGKLDGGDENNTLRISHLRQALQVGKYCILCRVVVPVPPFLSGAGAVKKRRLRLQL